MAGNRRASATNTLAVWSVWMLALSILIIAAMPGIAQAACPNESLRVGPSMGLPDCRAYERVTPAEVNGRILAPPNVEAFKDSFSTNLTDSAGDSFVYLTFNSPLLAPGGASGVFDLYQARRSEEGWQTNRRLSPAGDLQAGELWAVPGGISADHGYAFTHLHNESLLVYPDDSLELVGRGQLGTEPLAQGRYISPGAEHVVFSTGNGGGSQWCSGSCVVARLEPNAPPTGTGAIYDRSPGGPTNVISLLPGNLTPGAGHNASYLETSADGSAVAFRIDGILYVRRDDVETKEVSAGQTAFAGLSADGSYLFYVVGGDKGEIHRFDTASGGDVTINPGAEAEVVNVSADGSHVYFISEAKIAGNAIPGEPNLYVWDGNGVQYIATVAASDLVRTSGSLGPPMPALTTWTRAVTNPSPSAPFAGVRQGGPGTDSSRTTPDGQTIVFESRARLTPYDNAGHTEIYRYSGGVEGVQCLSCNDLGAPSGDARLENLRVLRSEIVVHNLSDDGSRVFFETPEGLVGRDVDGVNDIYEWHGEGGEGSVDLISSGESVEYQAGVEDEPWFPRPNVLLSATPTGSDVFFLSQDELVEGAGSGGTPGIYDARIGGGFPRHPVPETCSEEGCRPSARASVPDIGAPRSEVTNGHGNVRSRRTCHRGKGHTKGHRRCTKPHCPAKKSHPRRGCHGQRGSRPTGASRASTLGLAEEAGIMDSGAERGPAPWPLSAAEAEEPKGSGTSAVSAAGALGFGITLVEALLSTTTANDHPEFTTNLVLNHQGSGSEIAEGAQTAQSISVSLPPGLIGNPNAVPKCKMGEMVAFANCPPASQVGLTQVRVAGFGAFTAPVFNVEPPHPNQEVARLGFLAGVYPAFIDVQVRTSSDYGVTATVRDTSGISALLEAKTVLWGSPADASHDEQRLTTLEAFPCNAQSEPGIACKQPEHRRSSPIPPSDRKAFMNNPSACQAGEVRFSATSYQLPGQVFTASDPLPPITDCVGLPFAPTFEAEPTRPAAGAPTGIHAVLRLPQHLGEDERATATMREARVTLPEGMQVAAGAANWIGTCSGDQVGFHKEVDTACPDNSKLGTATIVSPALSTPIEGTIYQRSPEPGRQLGLWLTADALGLHIKLPGSLEPDKQTGRLTAVFTDLPQVPVEEIDLDVWGGPRAPLQNPDHCGTFTTDFSFSPHSNDPAATGQSTMQITEGCNQGFDPTLHAGVTDPVAGRYSPFVFDLTRPDGQQALRGFELKLPDGELAKLKGVPLCSDADANAASCPQGSKIGHLQATTGPGPEPFTLPEPGKPEPQIYLAGPYKGSPFSIVSEVPAQAGPFDLGVLAVRSGLDVEPEIGRAVVKADPLPQYFEGVGIAYQNLHAVVDRPEFNLNPTDCREMAVTSDVTSTQGTVAHPAARFQVDGCKALKFKPKLSLKLRGGTERADYPALTAVLKARKGDANIAATSVALPHSEFLAQEHIGTICTRKQFAADRCPKGSVYGKAKAITPLLDKPLAGPVYLRSSDHPLPDLVAKLGGELEIDLVGRIDSIHGGIRTSFGSVPDAPVTKFVLQMRGGKKGLLTNSTDICRGKHKATVQMKAQNGRAAQLRPAVNARSCRQ
jgi:hypothetical protein